MQTTGTDIYILLFATTVVIWQTVFEPGQKCVYEFSTKYQILAEVTYYCQDQCNSTE